MIVLSGVKNRKEEARDERARATRPGTDAGTTAAALVYYTGQSGNFVRADITFLRQDFSVNLPVKGAAPWPDEQRFDFVTRLCPLQPDEMAEIADSPGNYPQRQAVLHALHGLTGKDGGDSTTKWRELLDIATDKKPPR